MLKLIPPPISLICAQPDSLLPLILSVELFSFWGAGDYFWSIDLSRLSKCKSYFIRKFRATPPHPPPLWISLSYSSFPKQVEMLEFGFLIWHLVSVLWLSRVFYSRRNFIYFPPCKYVPNAEYRYNYFKRLFSYAYNNNPFCPCLFIWFLFRLSHTICVPKVACNEIQKNRNQYK